MLAVSGGSLPTSLSKICFWGLATPDPGGATTLCEKGKGLRHMLGNGSHIRRAQTRSQRVPMRDSRRWHSGNVYCNPNRQLTFYLSDRRNPCMTLLRGDNYSDAGGLTRQITKELNQALREQGTG